MQHCQIELAGTQHEANRAPGAARELGIHRFKSALSGGSHSVRRLDGAERKAVELRVEQTLKWRRRRESLFDAGLFADPAWDIMLELYKSELSGRRMAVSDVCSGAAVPPTTALRWIVLLESKGMILRRKDPLDGRRIFVSLSKMVCAQLDEFFRKLPADAHCL